MADTSEGDPVMDPPRFADLGKRFTVRGQEAGFVRHAGGLELDSFCNKQTHQPDHCLRGVEAALASGSTSDPGVAVGVREGADGRQQPETGLRFAFERGARSARRFSSPYVDTNAPQSRIRRADLLPAFSDRRARDRTTKFGAQYRNCTRNWLARAGRSYREPQCGCHDS
jgi:hypothetical protein